MALWSISPAEAYHTVTEVQTWTKFNHQLIREETFNWAEFQVNSDTEPVVDLNNETGYKVNHDPNYSWSLSQLMQTTPDPTVKWVYPSTMTAEEVETLKSIIEQGGYVALDADGWELSNTDFWFWGKLSLTEVVSEGEQS